MSDYNKGFEIFKDILRSISRFFVFKKGIQLLLLRYIFKITNETIRTHSKRAITSEGELHLIQTELITDTSTARKNQHNMYIEKDRRDPST